MATDPNKITATTSYKGEMQRVVHDMDNTSNQLETLIRARVSLADQRQKLLETRRKSLSDVFLGTWKARNDIVSSRTKLLAAIGSSDIAAAEREMSNIRNNYAKLADGYSAQSQSLVDRLQSEAAVRSGDPTERKVYVWENLLDRLNPANPQLPFALRVAEDTLGGPETLGPLFSPSMKAKYASLHDAADKIDEQRKISEAALGDTTRLGRAVGDPKTVAAEFAKMIPEPPPAPEAPDYTLSEEDIKGDAGFALLQKLDKQYEDMMADLDGSEQAAAAEQTDQMAEIVSRPGFQEYAADLGYTVGHATKNEDGSWTYVPGKDDYAVVRRAARQLRGQYVPPRRGHTNPTDYIAIDVTQPTGEAADALKNADGTYTTITTDKGTMVVAPEDADAAAAEAGGTAAKPVEFFISKDGAETWMRDGDTTSLFDPFTKTWTAGKAPDGAEWAPLYAGKTYATPSDVVAAMAGEDVEVAPSKPADFVEPTPAASKASITTVAELPKGETIRLYGKRVVRHPGDPENSIRVSSTGGERVLVKDEKTGAWTEDKAFRSGPERAFDYEDAVVRSDFPITSRQLKAEARGLADSDATHAMVGDEGKEQAGGSGGGAAAKAAAKAALGNIAPTLAEQVVKTADSASIWDTIPDERTETSLAEHPVRITPKQAAISQEIKDRRNKASSAPVRIPIVDAAGKPVESTPVTSASATRNLGAEAVQPSVTPMPASAPEPKAAPPPAAKPSAIPKENAKVEMGTYTPPDLTPEGRAVRTLDDTEADTKTWAERKQAEVLKAVGQRRTTPSGSQAFVDTVGKPITPAPAIDRSGADRDRPVDTTPVDARKAQVEHVVNGKTLSQTIAAAKPAALPTSAQAIVDKAATIGQPPAPPKRTLSETIANKTLPASAQALVDQAGVTPKPTLADTLASKRLPDTTKKFLAGIDEVVPQKTDAQKKVDAAKLRAIQTRTSTTSTK